MSSTSFYIASAIWPFLSFTLTPHKHSKKKALNTKIKKFSGPQRVFTSFYSYSKCLHEPYYYYPLWCICRNLEGQRTICTSLPSDKRSLSKESKMCWPGNTDPAGLHISYSRAKCRVNRKTEPSATSCFHKALWASVLWVQNIYSLSLGQDCPLSADSARLFSLLCDLSPSFNLWTNAEMVSAGVIFQWP